MSIIDVGNCVGKFPDSGGMGARVARSGWKLPTAARSGSRATLEHDQLAIFPSIQAIGAVRCHPLPRTQLRRATLPKDAADVPCPLEVPYTSHAGFMYASASMLRACLARRPIHEHQLHSRFNRFIQSRRSLTIAAPSPRAPQLAMSDRRPKLRPPRARATGNRLWPGQWSNAGA